MLSRIITCLILLFVLVKCEEEECKSVNPIKILKERVLCKYNKDELPRKGNVIIRMQMLMKYLEFDDFSKKISISSWILMDWWDRKLKFNRTTGNGIKWFYVESSEIWSLDLQFYDRIGDSSRSLSPTNCAIFARGRVVCLFPSKHTARCNMDARNWPYDVQNCTLSFVAWAKPKGKVFIRLPYPAVRFQGYKNNSVWKVLNYKVKKYVSKSYPGLEGYGFPTVTYSFLLERYAKSYVSMIVIRVIVFMLTSLVITFFKIDSFERLLLSSLNFLHHLFFQLQLLYVVQQKVQLIPYILIFLHNSMLVSLLIIVETMLLRNANGKESNAFLLTITNYMQNKNIMSRFFPVKEETQETGESDKKEIVFILTYLIDKLFFIILLLLYVYFFVAFMPSPNRQMY